MNNQQYHFDQQAKDYSKNFGLNSKYELDIKEVKEKMLNSMGKGKNVLYVGCGVGENLKQLSKNNEQLIGIDISGKMLKESLQQIQENGLKNVKLLQATVYDLPFKDQSFDRVYCINTFFHLKHRKRAISEMSRVTKGGGLVYLEMYSLLDFPCLVRRALNFFLPRRPGVFPSYISVEIVNLIAKSLFIRKEESARRKSVMGKPEVFFFVCKKEKQEAVLE